MSRRQTSQPEASGGQKGLSRLRDRYGLVLISTLATLLILAALGDLRTGRAIALMLLGGIFALTLVASSEGRGRAMGALIAVSLSVVAAIATGVAGATGVARLIVVLFSVAFVVASPVVIVRRLIRHHDVSTRTVMGALCLYVFLALFFAYLYMGYDLAGRAPFFAQLEQARSVDFTYFSLVTITTVGFGDLSPLSDLGRMTAVVEAIVGQLYLVTVIALLVSNLGTVRKPRGDSDGTS